MSVPRLFARAMGVGFHCGENKCFYCAAQCDNSFSASEYVKDSFTGRNGVPCPGSQWICAGCVLCLRESCEVPMLDGTVRAVAKAAMRSWSWVITASWAKAGSKANMDQLRAACVEPPVPPFALVLSDSGQKQLLYRGVVCHSREHVIATLEGEKVEYGPASLVARLDLCGRLVAATGKPALGEPPNQRFAAAVVGRYANGEDLIGEWVSCWEEPLSRLAAWLCGNKEWCGERYPGGDGLFGVPAQVGGGFRPGTQAARRRGDGGGEAGCRSSLYDLG